MRQVDCHSLNFWQQLYHRGATHCQKVEPDSLNPYNSRVLKVVPSRLNFLESHPGDPLFLAVS